MIQSTFIKKLDPEYVVDTYGDKKFYNLNGQLHSFYDCPAVIYPDGSKFWYKDGKRHRDNERPAAIWHTGNKEWWVDGHFIRNERV